MEKVLEGKLARFEVPDLLTFLNMGRRTGALVLERAQQETKLFFEDGNPVFATSSKPELRLGNMLVKAGRLQQAQIDDLFARNQGSGHRLGQLLLAEQVLTEAELASFLKVQVSEVIFDTFEWHEGQFMLYDCVAPPVTAVTLKMDLQNLIMEGVRRIDERGRLKESFPDLDMVVEAVANPERVKQSVTFTREEWQVFFLVDGRRSLREICRMVGDLDETATLQILQHLMAANFVSLTPPQEQQDEAEGAGTSPPRVSPGVSGTQRVDHQPSPPAAAPLSVQFTPSTPRLKAADDDAKAVVTREAMRYMGDDQRVTVSRLTLKTADGEQSFPLTRDSYTLGRHRNNDIVINDPKVSGFHARLDRNPDGYVIVDLRSRNGCHVNGKRVTTQLLQTGDELRMGAAHLVYQIDYTAE